MAKQLNLLANGQVISTALHSEMQRSYLEYAMSVIVGRALPDARDGLKPVHRRILYAMHELGLTPDRPFRKCARVVGDVLGKYHPHGDQAVYDAMVRMIQDFSCRYPLLAGHGNFGSIDNDPPAAMRYTETRLAAIGNDSLLAEIGEATVDFASNFDDSQQEPVVLPAQLPILLLNGCSGIAVGMATNIPPHNLGELIDGAIATIDRPTISDDKLIELIPGPDFPTGGEIVGTEGIRDAYTTGRGGILVRGVTRVEEIETGRTRRHRRTALVVTEFPYQVTKSSWIEKVAALVNQGKLEGISDIRDESDRDGIRVVIELKRETDPHWLLAKLHKLTPLQTNFGAILLALVGNQPRQLTLREMLQQFLDFREQTLTRQYRHELERTEERLHLLEGLLEALANLDDVIDILRHAPDGSTAKATFQQRFGFSDSQASAILAMPMRRLTGLERQNLQQEFDELSQRRQELQQLLSDRRELLKALKKELRSLRRKYGDQRRTRIITEEELAKQQRRVKAKAGKSQGAATAKGKLEPAILEAPVEEDTVVELTHRGYVRRVSPGTFERRKHTELPKTLPRDEDFTLSVHHAKTQQDLLVLTRTGKAYSVKIGDVPPTRGRDTRGTPVVSLLPNSADSDPEAIAAQFVFSEYPETEYMVFLTQQGRIKRLPLSEFSNITARGLTALKLKGDDILDYVHLGREREEVAIATDGGRVLRLKIDEEQLPVLGRTAQGYQALRLRKKERLAGCTTLRPHDDILLVTRSGYAKRLPVDLLRLANRGEIGTQALQFRSKSDRLAAMVSASNGNGDAMILTSRDRFVRVPLQEIQVRNKDGAGDRLRQLKSGETVVEVTLLGG
jgi:DNA gyrase subunit A